MDPNTVVCANYLGPVTEVTGIKRGYTQVREFLLHIGMKPRKVGSVPAKANPEEQEEFLKKLQSIIDEAQQGKRHVFFVDGCHFVWGAFLGILWSFERMFILTPSGRNRFNDKPFIDEIMKDRRKGRFNNGLVCPHLGMLQLQQRESGGIRNDHIRQS